MNKVFTTGEWKKANEAFLAAVDLAPEQQAAVVDEICGSSEELTSLVQQMLGQDQSRLSLMDGGLQQIASSVIDSARASLVGRRFGPYLLLRLLGEGGMGAVYLAEHTSNGMLAAIKFLPDARLSPARRERFSAEQKILAALDHPHIARMYYADVLPEGSPWFAMEYIGEDRENSNALPVDQFCEMRGLALHQRLQLMVQACEAMQYVHAKMVVHRDLKPTNLLVTQNGILKIIDFGIGKKISGDEGEIDLTLPGLRMMTVAYAAPELLRGGAALPAADIYALGVILFLLLAGKHPLGLEGCTATEAERLVLECKFQKPSVIARANRREQLASPSEWNDLDALCRKAMHPDESRRYATVEALQRDLQNFIYSRPLEARPDGFAYKANKFMRRNARKILSAGVLFLLVMGSVIYYTVRLKQSRDEAMAEAVRTQRVEKFMLDLMTNNESDVGPAEDTKLSVLAERGLKQARMLDADPEVQADLYDTLGTIYQAWGKSDLAWSLLQQAHSRRSAIHGEDSARTAESLLHMGMWKEDQEQTADAEQLLRKALAVEKSHPQPGRQDEIETLNGLALLVQRKGDYRQSILLANEAMQLEDKEHASESERSGSLTTQANNYYYMGDLAQSEKLNLEGLKIDKKLHGLNHPDVAEDLINLGNIETSNSKLPEAEQNFRQALAIQLAWYGIKSADAAETRVYLAQVLEAQKKLPESQEQLEQAIVVMEAGGREGSPRRLALAYNERGKIEQLQRQFEKAKADYSQSAKLYEDARGVNSRQAILVLGNLASVYVAEAKNAEAEKLYKDLLQRSAANPDEDKQLQSEFNFELGRMFEREKRLQEAVLQFEAGLRQVDKRPGANASRLARAQADLARIKTEMEQQSKLSR